MNIPGQRQTHMEHHHKQYCCLHQVLRLYLQLNTHVCTINQTKSYFHHYNVLCHCALELKQDDHSSVVGKIPTRNSY